MHKEIEYFTVLDFALGLGRTFLCVHYDLFEEETFETLVSQNSFGRNNDVDQPSLFSEHVLYKKAPKM